MGAVRRVRLLGRHLRLTLLLRRRLGLLPLLLLGGLGLARGFFPGMVRRLGLSALLLVSLRLLLTLGFVTDVIGFSLSPLLLMGLLLMGLLLAPCIVLGVIDDLGLGVLPIARLRLLSPHLVFPGVVRRLGLRALLVSSLHLLLALGVVARPILRFGLHALLLMRLSEVTTPRLVAGVVGGVSLEALLLVLGEVRRGLALGCSQGALLMFSLATRATGFGLSPLLVPGFRFGLSPSVNLRLPLLSVDLERLRGVRPSLPLLSIPRDDVGRLTARRLELRPIDADIARRRRRGGDHGRDAAHISLPLCALLAPDLLLLRRQGPAPLLVQAAPIGVAQLFGRPLPLRRQDSVAPGPPIASVGRLPPLVNRGVVQMARAEEVARCDLDQARGVVWIGSPVAVVDLHQPAVIVGVGVSAVADQERVIAVAAIEVLAFALAGLFDHAIFAVGGAPDPRVLALIVDGVVRRAVGEGVGEPIGVVDIGVDRPPGPREMAQRRGRRQGGRDRRRHCRRRNGFGQGQTGDRRAGDRTGGLLIAGGQRKARGGGQEKATVKHGVQTLGPVRVFPSPGPWNMTPRT